MAGINEKAPLVIKVGGALLKSTESLDLFFGALRRGSLPETLAVSCPSVKTASCKPGYSLPAASAPTEMTTCPF